MVQPGETVLTISLDRPLRVRAYVSETDLSRIAPGMAVTVRADGNPRAYRGTIGYISPRANSRPSRSRPRTCAPIWSIACGSQWRTPTMPCARASP